MSASEVQNLLEEFWALNDLHELAIVYDEIKTFLPSFLKLFHCLKNNKILGEKHISNVLRYVGNDLPQLTDSVHCLTNDALNLEDQKTPLFSNIVFSISINASLKTTFYFILYCRRTFPSISNYIISSSVYMNEMTEFSANIIGCIEQWSNAAPKCDGISECLEACTQQLRNCLDNVFPPSKSIDLESDKVNYLISSTSTSQILHQLHTSLFY